MKKNRFLLLLFFLLGLCALLFTLFYQEAKREAIHNLNVQQSLHARQAAQGIEDFFTRWMGLLTILSESNHIIDLDRTGREEIDRFYKANREQIRGITRVDANGRIIYTIPYDPNLIGRDLSFQNHIQEVMRTRKPVISDVFTAVQGYQTVALHVPVFGNGTYRGTIAATLDFRSVASRYFEVIKIGKTGYAWVISRDGTELYCPIPGHTGRSVYLNCEAFPSVLAMAGEMVKGKQGITTYNFDPIGGQLAKTVKKHAVYMPISLGNTFWSIVVASSEEEVLASLANFRTRLILVIALFMMGALLFSYYGLKARLIIREEEKRLKAEAALRESEEKYRGIFENVHDVYFETSLGGTILEVSPSIEMLSKGQYQRHELIGKSMLDIYALADERNALIRFLAGRDHRVTDYEISLKNRDGSIVPCSISAVMQFDAEGTPSRIIGSLRDISERKRSEQEMAMLAEIGQVIGSTLDIEEVYEHFASIARKMIPFDALTVNLIDLLNNRFRIACRSGLDLPGRTAGAESPLDGTMTEYVMRGQKAMIFDGSSAEAVTRQYPEITRLLSFQSGFCSNMLIPLLSNNIVIGVLHFRAKKQGVYHEAELRLAERIGLQITGAVANARLFSDLSRAEKSLRESERQFRTLVEQAAVGVAEIDMATGSYLTVNRRLCDLLGRTEEELLATTFYAVTHPEDLHLHDEASKMMAEGRIGHYSLEKRYLRKDGTIIYANVIVSPLWKLGEKPGRNMIVVQDITDRKQAEEERRLLEERLQHADKMEAIGTLAGGIAHDFNNLLMGIQGYASLALMNIDSSHPNYEKLRRIEEQVQSGADLTKQLLGFARGGRYEVNPTDMNEILEKSSSMFGRTKKEITIHRKLGKGLRTVEVDRGQMDQVFMNLYVNAWQAMPGGGEIYLETENVSFDPAQAISHSVIPGNFVKISITDTGTGMDEKTRERIFDPFFTTKEMGRGTGLGLATVYGIIKGHKGAITVYSELGHGTTFHVYLPASEKEVANDKGETGTIARGTETVLLVDDEKMVLEVSKELLEFLGYRVHVAGSGQEAIAVYMEKQKEISLVILDMIMPGISGGETFNRLREINPEVKVLLCSGYSINGEAKTIMNRGCNGFIQKPFQIEKFSGKVREILD